MSVNEKNRTPKIGKIDRKISSSKNEQIDEENDGLNKPIDEENDGFSPQKSTGNDGFSPQELSEDEKAEDDEMDKILKTTPPVARSPKQKGYKRPTQKEMRTREFLTNDEIRELVRAANTGRFGFRNSTMILMGFRHGLRVAELVALKWEQVNLENGTIEINRINRGTPSSHPLRGPELRALANLKKKQGDKGGGYIFTSNIGPISTHAVRKIIAMAGKLAGFQMKIHPHMLRHSCGHHLAKSGHDSRAIQVYMGHVNLNSTVQYTDAATIKFTNFFND
jgi:type 1 fimbriae regulatory protein FimB/type 1 fimbriae regulatory protein FimE